MDVLSKFEYCNPWWVSGKVPITYANNYKRKILFKLIDLLEIKQVIALYGLRGVGKKPLMFQIIEQIIKNKVNSDNILFFSIDQTNEDVVELVKAFLSNRLHNSLQNDSDTTYIFINECQYDKNIFDNIYEVLSVNKNVKFVLSFSSKVFSTSKHPEEFQNCIEKIRVNPLSFLEFLEISKVNVTKYQFKFEKILDFDFIRSKKNNYIKVENKFDSVCKEYLNTTSLIEFSKIMDAMIRNDEIKIKVLDKIIFKDMHLLHDVKFLGLINKIITYFCKTSSEVSNQLDISKKFKVSYPSLLNYIKYFQSCFLISDARNYYLGSKNEKRTNRKFYISDVSFMTGLDVNLEKKIKTLVFNHCHSIAMKNGWDIYYWQHDRVSIDLFIDVRHMLIPVDIKYHDNPIEKKEFKGNIKFLEKYKYERGVIISKNEFDFHRFEKCEIMVVPFWMFLLSQE